MRQVFSSPRIENVEGVARLLEEAGIEVRITGGRSYRGAIRGNFSYRDGERARLGPQPSVWVVQSADQPRARAMLREAGLLASTRMPQDSYLPPTRHARDARAAGDPGQRALRIKLGLLVLVVLAVALGFLGLRKPPGAAPVPRAAAPATTTVVPVVADAAAAYVVDTPPALAEMLLQAELEALAPPLACIAIDGKDPPADVLARMRMEGRELQPWSACDRERAAVRFDVNRYTTDGSGTGSVRLDMVHRTAAGERAQSRTLEVRRSGNVWRVLREL